MKTSNKIQKKKDEKKRNLIKKTLILTFATKVNINNTNKAIFKKF